MIERIKHTSGLVITVVLVAGFYVLSLAVASYATSPLNITTSVTVLSQAPTVSGVVLNSSTPITLTENTTTIVTCSGTVSSAGGYGDVSGVTSSISLFSVSNTCFAGTGADPNNCYLESTAACVTSSGSGTSMHVVCTDYIWFHADSTDASSSWSGQGWVCQIRAHTAGGDGSGTSATQTLNSLAAQNVVPLTITYGNLAPNTNASGPMSTTTVSSTGNIAINVLLKGSTMYNGINSLAPNYQHYSTSTLTNSTTLNADGVTNKLLLLGQGKPTTHPTNQTTAIGWSIDIPNAQTPGTYLGINTSTVISTF